MMNRPKIINKRADWQLFDKEQNRRVTLNDIRKMIVQGKDLRFVDEHSGDDVTIAALAYIIIDKERSVRRQLHDVLIA